MTSYFLYYLYRLLNNKIMISKEQKEQFYELHKHIVNEIIDFCNKNNIEAYSVSLSADDIKSSIPYNKWTAATDSYFALYDKNSKGIIYSV